MNANTVVNRIERRTTIVVFICILLFRDFLAEKVNCELYSSSSRWMNVLCVQPDVDDEESERNAKGMAKKMGQLLRAKNTIWKTRTKIITLLP